MWNTCVGNKYLGTSIKDDPVRAQDLGPSRACQLTSSDGVLNSHACSTINTNYDYSDIHVFVLVRNLLHLFAIKLPIIYCRDRNMSFLGGAECSTAGNPLTTFAKHTQNDNTLQRDRLVGRGPGGLQESMRSTVAPQNPDQMMYEFLQQPGQVPPSFAMDQMRPLSQRPVQRTPSPGWAAEYDPGEQVRLDTAYRAPSLKSNGFNTADFHAFQHKSHNAPQRTQSPAVHTPPLMNGYQRPMGMGYMSSMPMGMYNQQSFNQQQQNTSDLKGKSRMVELDDQNWEEQFAQLDMTQDQDNISEQARQDMERELHEVDRSAIPQDSTETDHFGDFESIWQGIQAEREANRNLTEEGLAFDQEFSADDLAAWDNFDQTLGLGTLNNQDPVAGDYMFEAQNPFLEKPQDTKLNPFDEGIQIIRTHGNLSLAALAFEAAVQQDPSHVEAWVLLGQSQAQNEKESPAIRALEHALTLDPNNLQALMGLAVSYTNEGYDSTAYRTLERWLSVKYPSVHPPDQVSESADIGFSDRALLHNKVTNLFIQAAQLAPSGAQMDPDLQVGLGVLFYGDEDFEKAVDCFNAALASTEDGVSNQQDQVHLLWNRLGATLANSGRSEDAIAAYERALAENPSFVRARYNLGVSCINIGCYPEAAQHLLGALSMHRVTEDEGIQKAKDIIGGPDRRGPIGDEELERMLNQNESTNIYDTLRRAFSGMNRRDLSEKVGAGMRIDEFRGEFDF